MNKNKSPSLERLAINFGARISQGAKLSRIFLRKTEDRNATREINISNLHLPEEWTDPQISIHHQCVEPRSYETDHHWVTSHFDYFTKVLRNVVRAEKRTEPSNFFWSSDHEKGNNTCFCKPLQYTRISANFD